MTPRPRQSDFLEGICRVASKKIVPTFEDLRRERAADAFDYFERTGATEFGPSRLESALLLLLLLPACSSGTLIAPRAHAHRPAELAHRQRLARAPAGCARPAPRRSRWVGASNDHHVSSRELRHAGVEGRPAERADAGQVPAGFPHDGEG